MTPSQYGFVCGCFAFGIFVLGHLTLLRMRNGAEPSRALMRMLAAAVMVAIVTAAFRPPTGATFILAEAYALLTFGCLFILYGPFFYAIHTSLSVESLVLVLMSRGRASSAALVERFASRQLLKGRLDTMVANHYLARDGEQYLLLPRGRFVAAVFSSLKRLWRLGAGG